MEPNSCVHGRRHTQPSNLQDGIVMCTTGLRPKLIEGDEYCIQLYFPVADRMIGELNTCFNDLNTYLMKAISACSPKSASFLDFDVVKPILDNYHVEENGLQVELIQAQKVLRVHNLQALSDVIDIL